MDDEQKPDLKPVTRSHCRKVAFLENNSSLSFHEWMNRHAAIQAAWGKLQPSPHLPPTSSQNHTHTKDKSWQGPPLILNTPRLELHPKQARGIPTRPRSGLKRKAQPQTQSIKKTAENLLCQVSCSSGLTLQQHLKGRPHKAKMEYMKMKRGGRQGMPRCDVCQIWCSDPASLDMHYKGQKHKSNLQQVQKCRERGGQKPSKAPILCELCGVPCMNEDAYQMHLKGRQHAINQQLRQFN